MIGQTACTPCPRRSMASSEDYLAFQGRFAPGDIDKPSLPGGLRAHLWRPGIGQLAPPHSLCGLGSEKMLSPVSLAFFLLVVAGRGRSSLGSIAWATDEHSAVQGFAILRGRDFRFPFMGPDDLQLGPVWTAEPYRRRGLAVGLCRLALRQTVAPLGVLWWLCKVDNQPSQAVAHALGLAATGSARRYAFPLLPVSYRYELQPFLHKTFSVNSPKPNDSTYVCP